MLILRGPGVPPGPSGAGRPGACRHRARCYRRTERRFQGIPGIEASPDGSLLITFYTGGSGEGSENHVVLASYRPSDDAVTDPIAVVDPPGDVRAFDPGLWVDPSGTLWWYWNQSTGWFDGLTWRTLGATNVWRVGPSTRFFLRRLASGRLLLVYHDGIQTAGARSAQRRPDNSPFARADLSRVQ